MYYGHEAMLNQFFADTPEISPQRMQQFALEHRECNPLGEPSAVMFRRTAIKDFGLFNPAFVSLCDLEYWLRIGVARGAMVVPEELATFRVHTAATSAENLSERQY